MFIPRVWARAVLAAILLSTAVCAAQRITRMSDRQEIGVGRMEEEIAGTRVILVGETHDVKRHHELQLDVIRALAAREVTLAIGLEMFSMESQPELDAWSAGAQSEERFRQVYARNWSMDWGLYRDILLYARDRRIPLIALNIPPPVMAKVTAQGFASLTPEERRPLPPDVTCVVNTVYTEFLRRVYRQHAANQRSFTYFCEAQTLRNSGMAWNIARYARAHPERTVVVLTGALHAVKVGVPEQLARYGEFPCTVILPELPGFPMEAASVQDADYFYR